jgi:5-methylcytosine-specific restriction endonuclease McrA
MKYSKVPKIPKTCLCCGRQFDASHKQVYCSAKCRSAVYSSVYGLVGKSSLWMSIRERIMERDNFSCKRCGKFVKEVNMEVHHIRPLHKGGKTEPSNLITLCESCHDVQHALISKVNWSRGGK